MIPQIYWVQAIWGYTIYILLVF